MFDPGPMQWKYLLASSIWVAAWVIPCVAIGIPLMKHLFSEGVDYGRILADQERTIAEQERTIAENEKKLQQFTERAKPVWVHGDPSISNQLESEKELWNLGLGPKAQNWKLPR